MELPNLKETIEAEIKESMKLPDLENLPSEIKEAREKAVKEVFLNFKTNN